MGKGSRFSIRKLLSRRSLARSKSPAQSVTPGPSTPSVTSTTAASVASTGSLTPADPSVAAAASNKGPSPWEQGLVIAQKKLSELGLPPLCNTPSQPASEIIESIVGDLQATIDNVNQNSNKAAARRMREFLKTFDGYTKIINTAVQHSPEITALVWAGVRAILQVALNHIEATESLEAATMLIAEKMAVCEFFASVYEEARTVGIPLSSASTTRSLQQALDLALPEFYAAILVFSMKARQFFDPSTHQMTKVKYMLKPFTLEFQPFIDEISEKERRVRDCADVATMETIKKNSSKLAEIHSFLVNQLKPLTKLDENLELTKKIHSRAEEKRLQKLLHILTPLESLKRHQDVRSIRLEGTGTWLLEDKRFLRWRDSPTLDQSIKSNMLCCYGDPGVGKTVICSIVVDNLKTQFSRQGNVGIAIIYCDYRDQTSQTPVNILGSLLWQLLVTASNVPEEVKEKLESIQKYHMRPEIKDISQMLKQILPWFHHTFICIDALDELDPRTRIGLLTSIRNNFSTARIFLTGRPIIQQDVNGHLKTRQEDAIKITPDLGDIQAYLEYKIKEDGDINPDAMNDKLKEEILSAITIRSKGMFLLPALHISMVLAHETISKRRKALERLPSSLDDVFSGMVNRILGLPNSKALGKRTLLLLHLAYQPLKLEELRHALAAEPGDTELDHENMPSRKTILDCCLGLVIVDEETMTVRFVHYTLEEHFKNYGSTYFPDGHSIAAEICLTYLNYDKISRHCATPDDLQLLGTEFPFLEYAAWRWGYYAREQNNESVTQLALKLLRQGREGPPSSFQMFYYITQPEGVERGPIHTMRATGVHVAAYFGLDKYIAALANDIEHWDVVDEAGRTPLAIAAERGHEAVVRQLLGRTNDVNTKDIVNRRPPLISAVVRGHVAVVRLLLERADVDVNTTDRYGVSPVFYAARRRKGTILRLLLERVDVNANSKDLRGQSLLSWAAEGGNEDLVKQFLQWADVDANSRDKHGRSPLSYAAQSGDVAIVRLLLERVDVDANSKDNSGRSPLSWAAVAGREDVVRLLLGRDDVDVNSKDEYGQSPLALAAENGYENVVRILLERDDIDADSKDNGPHNGNRTPLSWAAQDGRKGVVQLLLGRNDVDPNSRDNYGHTPLSYAARYGHEAIVRLLLERVDVDAANRSSSPLFWAARNGHEANVRLLLEQTDMDTNAKGQRRSPLSGAAEGGHEGIVRLLLERADVDTNSKDPDYGRPPLSLAVVKGYEAIVRLLLERDDVDVNLKDTLHGRSPLSLAAVNGHKAIVGLLLERDDVDVNSKCNCGRSPLSWAAERGYKAVVRLLLERDDVDVNSKCNSDPLLMSLEAALGLKIERTAYLKDPEYGRSPLSLAAGYGHEAVVSLLLERADVNTNSKDTRYGRSPLSWAAKNGHEAIVKLLLGRDDVDADSKDNSGRSPLSMAAWRGHEAVVRLLLRRVDIDADSKGGDGRSPLSLAAGGGHKAIVSLLLKRADVDADSKDNCGRSPLSWAAGGGHKAVVGLLLERADMDTNSKDTRYGRSPLSWAVRGGHKGVVKLLLGRDDVDADSKDNSGLSPLSCAAEKGHKAVVRLLLRRDDVDADSKDNSGRSPLSWAAARGHEAVVQLLRQHTVISQDAS